MSAAEVDDAEQAAERAEFEKQLRKKEPGMRAFLPGDNGRFNKTVVLFGSKARGWDRLSCFGGDHLARAKAYCDEYNGHAAG